MDNIPQSPPPQSDGLLSEKTRNGRDSRASLSGSPVGKTFDFLSGFGLATALLILLGLLTWFATLEQIDNGLHATLNKYFHWKAWYLFPEINGKMVPLPLPGGYWVGALLLLNLTLGGVIRIRKGWKHAGNLISHLGIVLMLVAGGVAHHFSEHGNMLVREGATNDAAEDFFEYTVEVTEIKNNKPSTIHVIRGASLDDLSGARNRVFRFPNLPFDLEVAGYLTHAVPVAVNERAPTHEEREVDGYYLLGLPSEIKAEANTAACYARVIHRDGSKSAPFILAGTAFHPFTVRHGDRVFTVDMRKRLWPMPFAVRLDRFTAEFHPGTMKPSKFVSNITRIENGGEAKVVIRMNEPMRYEGLTFFQASYDQSGGTMASVFEVVKNPADRWPQYSLYVVACGMLITFLTKFGGFIATTTRRNRHV
jgi:hypothetical protein